MTHPGARRDPTRLLDGRYRLHTPISEGVLLRELLATDEHTGEDVSVWLPHRQVSPAFEDIEQELDVDVPGCRRVLDLGRSSAFIVGEPADHAGPRPRRSAHLRQVVAGWFRAVAGIIDRNHRAGRWHGVLTCDDVAILRGKLVVGGFGFWVRTDPEAIAAAIAAPGAEAVRKLVAPEVVHSAIGPAADLWALGRCTLALASPSSAPAASHERQELRALAARHQPLAELLATLLDPDPDRRNGELRQLADQVTQALELPFADEPGAARRVSVAASRRELAQPDPGVMTGVITNVRTEALGADDLLDNEFRDSSTTVAEAPPARRAQVKPPPLPPDAENTVDEVIDDGVVDQIEQAISGGTRAPEPGATSYEPGTGMWTGSAMTAIDDGPGDVVPTPWSPLSSRAPIQVISMKDPAAPRTAPRAATRAAPLVPRIRQVEMPAQTRPSPAALGRIAPPRSHAPAPPPGPRRWVMTALVIAVAIAALLFAAALLWS